MHRPLLFALPCGARPVLDALCGEFQIAVTDTMAAQLREWILCRHEPLSALLGPEREILIDREIARELEAVDGERAAFGTWVYFPWRRHLVHLLPEAPFRLVRSNRNRNKLTLGEQAALARRTVGVIGLSVGHGVARLLAQEGVCGALRIADFDHLELSNLNRLSTSLVNVGLSKSVIAARDIAEIDPYLPVCVYSQGIDHDNVDDFMTRDGALDLVVEECDTLWVKLLVRERARQHRIPVLMDTSDRGMLDIERFDREPERPILHGLVGDTDWRRARDLEPAQRMELLYQLVEGADSLSRRCRESLAVLGTELQSIPQLASDVHLGAALVVHAARRIFLDQLRASGRYRVDLEAVITSADSSVHGE